MKVIEGMNNICCNIKSYWIICRYFISYICEV